MNATVQSMPSAAAITKPLWAAVGVLGFAVVAMGASLVYVQTRPVDGHVALAAMAAPALEPTAKVPVAESLKAQEDLVAPPPKPVVAAVKPVPVKVPPKPAPSGPVAAVVAPAPAPVALPSPSHGPTVVGTAAGTGAPQVISESGVITSQPVVVPAKPVCASCGTIESVPAVKRDGNTSGVGTVAGGALGAVVGNQIGKGSGRTMATILGAVGGGVAGHMIEKNVKKETVYQVRVRMEDGSIRTIEQASLPAVGSKVTVDGSVLHSADGSWSAPAPAQPKAVPQAKTLPVDART